MTIRRQYSLPNCTLILDGLSNGASTTGQPDPRPLMSILVNAECHFNGHAQPLVGGRDFLTSLIMSVSGYVQEFMSGVPHSMSGRDKLNVVELRRGDRQDIHQLIFHPAEVADATVASSFASGGSSPASHKDATQAITLNLTTVQLFDLVEAIDQFLADSRTLPDIAVLLAPVSKRHAATQEPLLRRAAPAAVGTTSLAAAALALYFIPVPRVQPPKDPAPKTTPSPQSSPTPTASPTSQSSAPASPAPKATLASDVQTQPQSGEITDSTQLYFLQRRLYSQLNQAWEQRSQVDDRLEYQVSVAPNGAVVSYKPVKAEDGDRAEVTPLPQLVSNNNSQTRSTPESVGQFKVVFTRQGILQVSPVRGYRQKPGVGKEITDLEQRRELQKQLREQLSKNWKGTGSYKRNLVYRVAVNKDGAIADYEPDNQSAFDYEQETPLPKLAKNTDASIALLDEPLAQYKVVFKPDGVLEVGTWR